MVICLGFYLLVCHGWPLKILFYLNIHFIHSYSSPVPWRAETKEQPVQQANFCADAALHCSRTDAEQTSAPLQAPLSPIHTQPAAILSPVTREREIARQKEQERRRRQAVSSASTSTSCPPGRYCGSMNTTWHPPLVFCLSRCVLLTYPCSETSWPCLRWTWTDKTNTWSLEELTGFHWYKQQHLTIIGLILKMIECKGKKSNVLKMQVKKIHLLKIQKKWVQPLELYAKKPRYVMFTA